MRLFIGFFVPEEIVEEIQSKINSEKIEGVRVSHKPHCTLSFLGDVSGEDLHLLKEALRKVYFKQFRVKLDGIGFLPHEGRMNVIYAGLEPAQQAVELEMAINGAISKLSFIKQQERKFMPHVTIARVGFVKDKKRILNFSNIIFEEKWFTVSSFFLIKSELTKERAVYTIIEEFMGGMMQEFCHSG